MSLRIRLLTPFAATILLASPFLAHATAYTYTYTGQDFTQIRSTLVSGLPGLPPPTPFTTSNGVTGYITLSAPLAPNQSSTLSLNLGGPSGLQGACFYAGPVTACVPSFFEGISVTTDSLGNIDAWSIGLGTEPSLYSISTSTFSDSAFVTGLYLGLGILGGSDSASNANAPGSWAESINGVPVSNSPVPEPSTFILLATGILGLAAATIRRLPTT